MTKTILQRLSRYWICPSCRHHRDLLSRYSQPFSTSSLRCAEDQPLNNNEHSTENPRNLRATPLSASLGLNSLGQQFDRQQKKPNNVWEASSLMNEYNRRMSNPNYDSAQTQQFSAPSSSSKSFTSEMFDALNRRRSEPPPNLGAAMAQAEAMRHHFHIYATKHNTHITLTSPQRNPILSLSAGNIGFRKAGRGSYDAAYQLAAYMLKTLQEKGIMGKIEHLEVVLRGFGPGREAVSKVLLGSEGRWVRGKINKVTDATRLKFGGTRSPKPRRLG